MKYKPHKRRSNRRLAIRLSLILLGLIVIGLALFWLFDSDSTEITVESVPSGNPKIVEQQKATRTQSLQTPQPNEAEAEDEFITEEFSEQLSFVADAYELQSRYPVNSRLVTDQELASSPERFAEARVEGKMPGKDGKPSPITLAVAVDKIQYFAGDFITLQLLVSGAEENSSVSASANIRVPGSTFLLPSNTELTAFGNNDNELRATFNSSDFSLASPSNELLVKVDAQVDDKTFVTTVPFLFSSAAARLENVSQSRPEGDSLVIPLEYSVFESGYYFVHAYLDDEASGKSLLSLQAEGPMQQGNDRLVLKAHQQALKDAGSQGPYLLRVVKSFRGAEPGQGEDVPTSISQRTYSIPATDFESYDDTPHSDPEVQEILEELNGLGNELNK